MRAEPLNIYSDSDYQQTEPLNREQPRVYNADTVIRRLEDAGRTLLSLPSVGLAPARLKAAWPEFAQAAVEAYADNDKPLPKPVPSSRDITLMDEAYAWVALLPKDKVTWRRLVLLRSLIHPTSERYLWGWRKLERTLGTTDTTAKTWHAMAIDRIVSAINRPIHGVIPC